MNYKKGTLILRNGSEYYLPKVNDLGIANKIRFTCNENNFLEIKEMLEQGCQIRIEEFDGSEREERNISTFEVKENKFNGAGMILSKTYDIVLNLQ